MALFISIERRPCDTIFAAIAVPFSGTGVNGQRMLGIRWIMIQTAGMGEEVAGGILFGVVERETVRSFLLARRRGATGANRSGA
jgi:hypothetical protein